MSDVLPPPPTPPAQAIWPTTVMSAREAPRTAAGRVLIVDGHPAVGRGLKALVDEMPGLRVVGLASRGETGLARAALTRPDVVLVDADLPGLCSMAVIRLLRWRLPATRIVALGIYPERLAAMRAAGADALILKDAGYDALFEAIAGGASAADGEGVPA